MIVFQKIFNHLFYKPVYMTSRFLDKNEYLPQTIDGVKCCRYCRNPITQSRRRTFCSQVCVDEYMIRSSGSYLRRAVYKRDLGICADCGVDTKTLARQLLSFAKESLERKELLTTYDISEKRVIRKRRNGGGLWDADHIIPVKDGGGCCGLDNLKTLCISCHKKKTFSKCNVKQPIDESHSTGSE